MIGEQAEQQILGRAASGVFLGRRGELRGSQITVFELHADQDGRHAIEFGFLLQVLGIGEGERRRIKPTSCSLCGVCRSALTALKSGKQLIFVFGREPS